MSNTVRGTLSGLVGSLVLAALILLQGMIGFYPDVNVVALLSKLGGISIGQAWADHFIIGIVLWGLGISAIDATVTGAAYWVKGLLVGLIGWLIMMLAFMPWGGSGLFGWKLGAAAPLLTLADHVIYGLILGISYGILTSLAPPKTEEANG